MTILSPFQWVSNVRKLFKLQEKTQVYCHLELLSPLVLRVSFRAFYWTLPLLNSSDKETCLHIATRTFQYRLRAFHIVALEGTFSKIWRTISGADKNILVLPFLSVFINTLQFHILITPGWNAEGCLGTVKDSNESIHHRKRFWRKRHNLSKKISVFDKTKKKKKKAVVSSNSLTRDNLNPKGNLVSS